jgi:hypothetical protein
MKKQVLTLMTSGVIAACSVFALHGVHAQNYVGVTILEKTVLQQSSFVGPTVLKEVTANSLSVIGPFEFYDLKVTKETNITGPTVESEKGTFRFLKIIGTFTAKNITCTKLEIIGPVDVTDLKVSEETDIVGPLKATQSTFQKLSVMADKISLDDVAVDDITIQKNKNHQKAQVLQLKGKTIVKGNITFESGEGIVEQDQDVKIQGEIKGAIVQQQ